MPWLLDSGREKCRGETVDTEAWMSLQRNSQSAATKSKDSMCSCSFRLGSSLSSPSHIGRALSPEPRELTSRKPNELLEAAPQLIGERLKRGHKSQPHSIVNHHSASSIIVLALDGLARLHFPHQLNVTPLHCGHHFCLARKAKGSLGPSARLPSRRLCALACRHCLSSTSLSTRVACWLDSCLLPTKKAMPRPRESLSKDGRAQT
jgi:hypothetical protein